MNSPIRSSEIQVTSDGGSFDAYLALPPAGSGPGLLLFQEIFGVNQHIRTLADQYALDGFVVLASDVFWRSEPGVQLGYSAADIEHGRSLMQALQPNQLLADLKAGAGALRARQETAGRKVGAIGWCFGGRLAYTAAAVAGIDAAVAYYGGGIHEQLHLARAISCPIQFHYAGRDDHIPPAAVDAVRAALPAAEVHVYPDTMHGFNCWARGSYHAASAALAHGRALSFLARALF